jgi:DNA-binding IclR family transcriptional regulator
VLTLQAGSAAQVLLAWEDPVSVQAQLTDARFGAEQLAAVRRRGWAHSVGEREAGVASVSAPVRNAGGGVIAAICVSGPISRLTRQPGRLHAPAVVEAAEQLSAALSSPVGAP